MDTTAASTAAGSPGAKAPAARPQAFVPTPPVLPPALAAAAAAAAQPPAPSTPTHAGATLPLWPSPQNFASMLPFFAMNLLPGTGAAAGNVSPTPARQGPPMIRPRPTNGNGSASASPAGPLTTVVQAPPPPQQPSQQPVPAPQPQQWSPPRTDAAAPASAPALVPAPVPAPDASPPAKRRAIEGAARNSPASRRPGELAADGGNVSGGDGAAGGGTGGSAPAGAGAAAAAPATTASAATAAPASAPPAVPALLQPPPIFDPVAMATEPMASLMQDPKYMAAAMTAGVPGLTEAALKRSKRLMRNREAARECRRKRKEYVYDIENRVHELERANRALSAEVLHLRKLMANNPAGLSEASAAGAEAASAYDMLDLATRSAAKMEANTSSASDADG